jgi:hypothetical protein
VIGDTIECGISHEHIVTSHHYDTCENRSYDDTPISMELVESEIAINVLELIGIHDLRGLFDEFSEDDISFESSPDWPASHDGELFFGRITSGEHLCISRLDGRSIGDTIGILVLIVIGDDLVSIYEGIYEGKYIIVLTRYPWIVR